MVCSLTYSFVLSTVRTSVLFMCMQMPSAIYVAFFFFNVTATTEIYPYLHTISLHDAFPILIGGVVEGYVANTTPKNDPEHRPEYEVVEILGVRSDGVASGEMETVPPAEQDPGDVRQCVPPNYQRADLESNRVDVGERDTRHGEGPICFGFWAPQWPHRTNTFAECPARQCPAG